MADSTAFDCLCATLEEGSSLERLEARGTVRLALKQAGLDARTVTPDQLCVVVEKLLPGELESRGVDDPQGLCGRALADLRSLRALAPAAETPEAVFQRLGGS